ncbi:NlpC/P60 family protein [Pendulispora albinea]|uniref:NlpC/P60 family protein n=1 Tax=Pendulispora albinea TaxID=2741071 RepID=A0ABZ2M5Q2_9BACT
MRILVPTLGAMLILTGCSSSGHRRWAPNAALAPPVADAEPASPEASTRISEVITYAEAQVGKPYCWGGEGPRCFDCAGLAQMAWSRAGVRIPRTSHDIARSLPEVAMDELRAGDLLWWPGHVAIYEGNGWMIEAFNSRRGVVRRPTRSYPPRRAFRPVFAPRDIARWP